MKGTNLSSSPLCVNTYQPASPLTGKKYEKWLAKQKADIPPHVQKRDRALYIYDNKGKKLSARLDEMIAAKYESPAAKRVRLTLPSCTCNLFFFLMHELGNV